MEKFCVIMPIEGEYLTTVRLTVGGLCALADMDVDLSEDYKVCITESLLLLKRQGYTGAEITFQTKDGLTFSVTGVEKNGTVQESVEDEISKALLTALLDNVRFVQDENGKLQAVVFEG